MISAHRKHPSLITEIHDLDLKIKARTCRILFCGRARGNSGWKVKIAGPKQRARNHYHSQASCRSAGSKLQRLRPEIELFPHCTCCFFLVRGNLLFIRWRRPNRWFI
jgi:hypothetical protein